jgi:hypothetical protein
MPRWISDNPNPAPRLAHTIIAGWRPTTYYMVGTIEYLGATGTDGLKPLIRSLPGVHPRDEYIIEVFKCDRYGMPRPRDPYYQHHCDTREQALEAHGEVVRLLCAHKLKLKRVHRDF